MRHGDEQIDLWNRQALAVGDRWEGLMKATDPLISMVVYNPVAKWAGAIQAAVWDQYIQRRKDPKPWKMRDFLHLWQQEEFFGHWRLQGVTVCSRKFDGCLHCHQVGEKLCLGLRIVNSEISQLISSTQNVYDRSSSQPVLLTATFHNKNYQKDLNWS